MSASEAYPPFTHKQLRRLQAQSTGTTYVHDWLTLIDIAAKRLWKDLGRDCAASCSVPEMPHTRRLACSGTA